MSPIFRFPLILHAVSRHFIFKIFSSHYPVRGFIHPHFDFYFVLEMRPISYYSFLFIWYGVIITWYSHHNVFHSTIIPAHYSYFHLHFLASRLVILSHFYFQLFTFTFIQDSFKLKDFVPLIAFGSNFLADQLYRDYYPLWYN